LPGDSITEYKKICLQILGVYGFASIENRLSI